MTRFNGNYNGKLNGIIKLINPSTQNPFINVDNVPVTLNITKNGKNK